MSDAFLPPMPQNISIPNGDPNFNASPNVSNVAPGGEKQSQWSRSVIRSGQIKAATSAVITTRSQFKTYLQQNGMDLFTSAVEFQQNGDFILSSYIIYKNHKNYQEPLASFLQRYPQLQPAVIAIRDKVRPAMANMKVVTPKLSQMGQYPNLPF
jgi:hypothetical protein